MKPRRSILDLVRPQQPLESAQWSLLVLLGITALVNDYDFAIQVLALPQIQAGLGIGEHEVGGMIAVMRLGVAPALLLAWWADRAGRRRLLLITILAFTSLTVATAFARTADEFMWLQFAARAFLAAEEMLAIVVLAEELPAPARGYGIGVLAAAGALGHGVASLLFAQVNALPYGWRALYVLAAAPLLLVAWYRRGLPETRRFAEHDAERTRSRSGGWRDHFEPFINLATMYPSRMAALVSALFPWAFVMSATLTFQSKLLQQEHGWSPGDVATLYIGGGALAVLGNLVAGSLGDRFGRRRLLVAGVGIFACGAAWFYGPARGIALPAAWILMMFGSFAAGVLFSALGSELFPTSHRTTASAARSIIASLGAALGLWTEGQLYELLGSHEQAIRWLLFALAFPPLIVSAFLPETARRELEDIAPEHRPRTRPPHRIPTKEYLTWSKPLD